MTPDELELYNQRLEEKEKRLQEQAAALQARQAEMETRNPPESTTMEQILQRLSFIDTLPETLEALNRRITEVQNSTSRPPVAPSIPSSPPVLRTQSVQDTPFEQSPIKLKDAIDTIPKYDGHKMSVFHFSKICERALQLIPQYHEYHLVQLIINKLQGHAYSAVEGIEFHSVFELTRRLKRIFGPNKTTDQYRGEFANIYMRYNEDIFDYVTRVKELYSILIDCETDITGYISNEKKDELNHTAMTNFINGLPSDLLVRVKLEGCYDFEDSIATAIQLSKTIETEAARKRPSQSIRQPRADFPQLSPRQSDNVKRNDGISAQPQILQRSFIKPLIPGQPGPNFPTKVCHFCKTPGHFMRECRKFAYQQRIEQAQQPQLIHHDSGNAKSVPTPDARRSEISQGRQTQNVTTPSTTRVNVITAQEAIPLPSGSIK